MEWLKNNPLAQIIINGTIMFIGLLLMFWITTSVSSNKDVEKEITNLKLTKTGFDYVDSQDKAIETHVLESCEVIQEQIDDRTQYDKQQDLRIETMRKEWREDQKEILTLIRGMK